MIREIEDLFQQQIQSWPLLAKGIEGLAHAKTRPVRIDWFDVFIRHIPHRVKSTTAAVDRASILKRPCFLCPQNQDPEEKGIAFGDFILYCNPFPIVNRHLSIVHREHGAQRIAGQFGNMLDLAKALSDSFIIYNGPECGASAPEPMINIAVFHDRKAGWTVYLFPRGKHRPQVFHTGELTVSPASIDLCGIFVVPFEKDFERSSGENIAAILREVTLPDDQFNQVAAELEGVR